MGAVAGALALLTACNASPTTLAAGPGDAPALPPAKPEIAVTPSRSAEDVAPGDPVRVEVSGGTLSSVEVTADGSSGRLTGERTAGGASWVSTQDLEFDTAYTVKATATNLGGKTSVSSTFTTVDPEQTVRAHVAPLEGETVGVGMPIAVYFTAPVENRAAVERRLSVETPGDVEGAWHWMDDEEVHFRPRAYWPANTDITLHAPLDGVNAGNGVWGDEDREISFQTGDRMVSRVDVNDHTMTVSRNGEVLRRIPVTAGKAGYETRNGTKVVLAKQRDYTMDATTTGVSKDDPEYYRVTVDYAIRVTWSGEFLHDASWSTGSQGSANVSHGCVGMKPSDARWLYGLTRRGDVVEVTGSGREMELRNGYGDWTLSWQEWQEGSALH
ncbi:MAG: L,D-transpeptidase [Actinomycetes bacterium]